MALDQIITQIKRKNSGGNYDTFYLGAEQRYSGALPTSNNNNLEEQLLMGVDRIIKTWHDDQSNEERQTIEFRRENDLTDYYILDSKKTGNNIIVVRNDVIYFENNMNAEDDILKYEIFDPDMYYSPSDETFNMKSKEESEEHILYYIQSDGTRLKVSSKNVIKNVDENNVVTVKEVITNYL